MRLPMRSAERATSSATPWRAERDQRRELLVVERSLLRRRLQFDITSRAGHHHVHIHVGLRIFLVAEIEHRHAADDAHAGGRDEIANRGALQRAELHQLAGCAAESAI